MRAPLLLVLICTLLLPASFAAAHSEQWFDNGLIHFPVDPSLFVSINTIESPEGPVEVVRVQPSNVRDGATEGQSFLLISIFREPFTGEGSQEEQALASVLDGARVALERFASVNAGADSLRVGGDTLRAQQLRVSHGGARATIRAAVTTLDGQVVVYYLHEAADEDGAEQLGALLREVGAGAAPDEVDDDEHRTILPRGLRVGDR